MGREEHIDYTEYKDFTYVVQKIAYWMEVNYRTERIHLALEYMTPSEFDVLYNGSFEPRIPQFNSLRMFPKNNHST